jgi:hypothetical protein
VDHAAAVEVGERFGDADGQVERAADLHRGPEQLVEKLSSGILEHQGEAIAGRFQGQCAHRGRRVELTPELERVAELRELSGRGLLGAQHVDDHPAAVGGYSPVDNSALPLTHDLVQGVTGKHIHLHVHPPLRPIGAWDESCSP